MAFTLAAPHYRCENAVRSAGSRDDGRSGGLGREVFVMCFLPIPSWHNHTWAA